MRKKIGALLVLVIGALLSAEVGAQASPTSASTPRELSEQARRAYNLGSWQEGRGEVVGVGPFVDAAGGNMALFRTRVAAEAFAEGDPFVLEEVVKAYQIKDWGDQTLK